MKITGTVIHGGAVGRGMGFPTANLEVDGDLTAANGVYAAYVTVDGVRWEAMANLGVKPTFGGRGGRVLELHLLGFEGDLYGRRVEAELVEFVRPERKFESVDELRKQILHDQTHIQHTLRKIK